MLTSCFRLLTRVARQPATFCSEFSARQRFVRIFHHLSGISTTEFTTMSDTEEWERVENSGKSKKKGKGNQTSPEKPKKGNEKRPQTTNGTTSKTAKEGSVVTPKDTKTEKAVESPAKNESCPWLNVSSEDSDDGAKNTSTTNTNTSEKKKKSKKKKKKNKDKQDSDHDAKTPRGDSAETTSPQVTNGVKPDSDKTTAPKSTETKSESQEATGEESTKTTTAKSSESTQPDDDDAPMNWEDAVVEQDKASEDKSHAAVADKEESSASQASPAEETSKGKIPTDNSEGEGSPSKKMTDSGASDKPVSFGWKKSHSNEKLQTGARERDRQGSTERKHTFKKPEATPAEGKIPTDNSEGEGSPSKKMTDSGASDKPVSFGWKKSHSNEKLQTGARARDRQGSTERKHTFKKPEANPAEGKIPTDNSEGEGSPSKKMTDSGASDKPVSFGWKKSHSNEKLQTGARERDRQGSTERKHTFKKPEANPAEGKILTDNSEGEGSPSKKMTDSGASDKPVSFGWKKSHSNEKLQTGARERDRQGSTERKHTFKKPEATPAEGKIPTDNSEGEGSPSKKMTDSGASDKPVSFGWKKSHSNEKLQTGARERDRQGSTERKHTFKKPEANPAEGKLPTDNSEGEGSPSKKMTDSGASDKPVSFGWKKSHSNEKLQTGARARDRQGSTERKHTFKKPEANPADGNSNTKRNTSARDRSHERRSDSKEKGRHGSADRSRSDRRGSDSTAGSRKGQWEQRGF